MLGVYTGSVFVKRSHNEPEGSAAATWAICIGRLTLAKRKTSWTMTVIKTDSGTGGPPQMFSIFALALSFKKAVFSPREAHTSCKADPLTGFGSNAA